VDQSALVTEQIDAGAELVREFDKVRPLKAAFWLKERDTGEWYIYLVSDKIDDTNFDTAYGEVARILGPGPHLWLDPFQVRVKGLDDPISRKAVAFQNRYPSFAGLTRTPNNVLGGAFEGEACLYPVPATGPYYTQLTGR
jgi:hypothetical protein